MNGKRITNASGDTGTVVSDNGEEVVVQWDRFPDGPYGFFYRSQAAHAALIALWKFHD